MSILRPLFLNPVILFIWKKSVFIFHAHIFFDIISKVVIFKTQRGGEFYLFNNAIGPEIKFTIGGFKNIIDRTQ